MGCVRVDKITDYIAQPLGKCLKDQDPYVRKTAVICVAKLFDINPSLCEMNGFLEDLVGMIGDANPMVDLPFYRFGFHIISQISSLLQVVSNAIAALSDIFEDNGNKYLATPGVIQKLLTALNECNE